MIHRSIVAEANAIGAGRRNKSVDVRCNEGTFTYEWLRAVSLRFTLVADGSLHLIVLSANREGVAQRWVSS